MDMQQMLEEINKKIDAIMEHLGCNFEDNYKKMSSEEKDDADEKEVLGEDEEK